MATSGFEGLQIFGGAASVELASKVATELGTVACFPTSEFGCGEILCDLPESIRGQDVYVIESHNRYQRRNMDTGEMEMRSPQDALVDHLWIVNAARSSWAGRVIACSPMPAYGRQDRRTGRQPVAAKLVFDMFKNAGSHGFMSVDMHSAQAEGFFDGPFEHLTATPTLVEYARKAFPDEEFVVVSPDNGRMKAAGRFRDQFGRVGLAVIDDKVRQADGTVRASQMLGASVKGLPCIISDDMIDGGGTIVEAARIVHDAGASHITAMATHGIFSGRAARRLKDSPIDTIVVTDTVQIPESVLALERPRIEVVSIAEYLARAIKIVHDGGSVTDLHGTMPQRI
ncbi:MAG TPA: ribose-phosphate diphosphokinase [Patescibacteria group bacterium]|nr:ribose-phosphate diphosphokinase [Patescibacteria group bacterium]